MADKFPLSLRSVIRMDVKRPKKSRSRKEKDEKEEILVISGIEFDCCKPVKFDVLINNEDDKEIRADSTEFAGSFVNMPRSNAKNKNMKTCLRLGMTELLENLEAEDDDSVTVTLVPKIGTHDLTIGNIKIEFDEDE